MKTLIIIAALLFGNISAQQILIDENFDDWSNVPADYENPSVQTGLDFVSMKLFDDVKYLYFYLELNEEINLQNDNKITLYVDTDDDPTTGESSEGIGVDLKFIFGDKRGTFYYDGGSATVKHYQLGFLSAPTVTSKKFEFAFDRNSTINGIDVFPSNTIKYYFKMESSDPGFIPVKEKTFENNAYVEKKYHIEKYPGTDIRVLTYNVERDHLFDADRKDYFRRLITAANPDIIGFQEIYDHSSQDAVDLINEFLPGYEWHHKKSNNDIIYVGKYPALSATPIDGNTAFTLDLQEFGKEALFISAHTPCCANDDGRQREIDRFMAFVRDAKNGTGSVSLPENSPIIIVGDMNLVGLSRQQRTLLTGDIVNQSDFGPSFKPDWDETNFEDTKPYATGRPAAFTWYDEGSDYYPGRLDYIVYSGSVLEKLNGFSLFTPGMSADSLAKYGLQKDDAVLASDHIPTVGDFKLRTQVGVGDDYSSPEIFELYQNYPNPFNPTTTIKYSIPAVETQDDASQSATLKIYDVLGREVATLVNEKKTPGNYSATFDAKNLTSGVYLYKLSSAGRVKTKKMILIK